MIDLNHLPPRLKRSEAPEYLYAKHGIKRTASTLAKLACVGGGPAFRKDGAKYVVYDLTELDRWAEEILGAPLRTTSDKCGGGNG